MTNFDLERDVQRVYDVVAGGGVAIIPATVGYAIVGATPEAIERVFRAKQRKPSKYNAFTGCPALHASLHEVDARGRAVVRAITEDLDLPLGTVARFRADHPMVRNIPPQILSQSTKSGTLAMMINGGAFATALGWHSFVNHLPIIGSSANRSLHGVKFRVEEIEPEVRAAADVIVDYGLMRWVRYDCSSTMLNVNDMTVVRHGIGFELIQDRLRRQFGIDLPDPPAQ